MGGLHFIQVRSCYVCHLVLYGKYSKVIQETVIINSSQAYIWTMLKT